MWLLTNGIPLYIEEVSTIDMTSADGKNETVLTFKSSADIPNEIVDGMFLINTLELFFDRLYVHRIDFTSLEERIRIYRCTGYRAQEHYENFVGRGSLYSNHY